MTRTVYLIDDDDSIIRALSRALKVHGYSVEAFYSAQSFLDVFSTEMHGCLVLDLSMPVMDGLTLQQELNRRGSILPIIFISGHGGTYESNLALSQGAVEFLEKPFAQSVLIEKIELTFSKVLQAGSNPVTEQTD